MANITSKDIDKIAKLAMIEIDPSNKEILIEKIDNVLQWVKTLDEVDTSQIQPITSLSDHNLMLNEDQVKDGNISQQILKNSKEQIYGYFTVPKVIE
jgi:aspartyl-tRNA(Asn)/glutamyl-tRNA(Gln) amidotransferase subunit C